MPLPSRDQLGSIRWHLQRLHGSGLSPPPATSEPPATPKKVPPTPNNTPESTPAALPTKSLGTAIDKPKKATKMAKRKSTRGRSRSRSSSGSRSGSRENKQKRHLCRWDTDMDQKLLLSFQYASNMAGLAVPWDEIGRVLGENITGSAVIQHLAKTRIRMQKRGLQVPPPLRRGGGGSSRIPATGTAAAPTTAATADKSNLKAKTKAKTTPRKAKKATKKGDTLSDDSGSDDDWKDDDSDAEYGGPAAKRAKSTKGPMKRKIKTEDSDDEIIPPSKAPKRKASDFKPSEERSAFGHTDINGVPIDDDMETEDETMVGSGQPWLELDEDNGKSTTSKKTPVKKTLVVSLPTTPAKADIFKAGDHENNVVGDVQAGYQIENHGDPFTNGSTEGLTNTNGYGGAYGNNGGFQSQGVNHDGAFPGSFVVDGGFDANLGNNFDTNMTGDGSISDSYHFGSGSTVPYPIQTSWPDQGSMGSSSYYPSLDQTPAATSAGADFGGGYFENSQFDIGSFDDASYDFSANNSNLFNPDEVDGNFVNDGYFGSSTYGN